MAHENAEIVCKGENGKTKIGNLQAERIEIGIENRRGTMENLRTNRFYIAHLIMYMKYLL